MGKNTHFLLLSLCLLFASLNVSAGPITRSQAQQKAEAMMRKLGGNRKLSPVKSARKLAPHKGKATTTADETELYYVFNRGEGDGYVIMAGENERNAGIYTLKNMQTGEQQSVSIETILNLLKIIP